MDIKPSPLDYASPETSPRPAFSKPAFVASALVMLVLLIVLVLVAPAFDVVFKDYAVLLPKPTQILLDVSFLARRRGGWALIVSLPIVIGFLAARLPPPPPAANAGDRPRLRRTSRLIALTIGAIGAIIILTIIALCMPLIRLMHALRGT
jgi:type II secretory pathway component PulF